MGNWKQYGIVIFGLLLGLGFGGSMFANNYVGTSSSSSPNRQQTTRNYTEPGTNFQVGSFNKSFNEQVVIAAQNDKAFVNAYYGNTSQLEELKKLRSVADNWGNRVYVQLVNSSEESEVLTRYGVINFPKVVVLGGVVTRRGLAPQQRIISNITRKKVERGICEVITNLKDQAARCQAIGAF